MFSNVRRIYKFVGPVVGTIMAAGSLTLDGLDIATLGIPYWGWTAIGAGIFGVSMIAFVHLATRTAESNESLQKPEPAPAQTGNGPEIPLADTATVLADTATVKVAQSRRHLERPKDEVNRFDKVWLLMHTGVRSYENQVWEAKTEGKPIVERLIVFHPDGKYLAGCAAALGEKLDKRRELDRRRDIIKTVSAQFESEGVDVKWYDGPIAATMMIGNPGRKGGLIRLEVPLEFSPLDDRPSFYIESDSVLFKRLVSEYRKIWDAAADYKPTTKGEEYLETLLEEAPSEE